MPNRVNREEKSIMFMMEVVNREEVKKKGESSR